MSGTAGPTNSMWIFFERKRASSSPKTGNWSNSLSGPVQISSPRMFGMSAPDKCLEILNSHRYWQQIQRLRIAANSLLKKVWQSKELLLGTCKCLWLITLMEATIEIAICRGRFWLQWIIYCTTLNIMEWLQVHTSSSILLLLILNF